MAKLYLVHVLPSNLKELGMNLGKILAKQILARPSWIFMQDICKILEIFFSGGLVFAESYRGNTVNSILLSLSQRFYIASTCMYQTH